jgi:hypothetical protein
MRRRLRLGAAGLDGQPPACSNVSVAAPYTEWLVPGAAATHSEGRPMWDNAKMEIGNNKDATGWIKPVHQTHVSKSVGR